VRQICLLGVRLGALLAALVATGNPVDFLIAVAPVTSGRRYIRELRAFQAATGGRAPAEQTAAPPSGDQRLDVAGFAISAASLESLEQVDLSKSSALQAGAVLILDRNDLPGAKSWATALQSRAIQTEYQSLPGFNEMVSTPHAALIPTAMLDAMRGWFERHSRSAARAVPIASGERLPAGARMRVRHDAGPELIERATFIDGERTLFAIVTEPAGRSVGTETSGYGVVMLNTGATHHVGPNRMYVDLARDWAGRGYIVMRLDLAGLGDSNTRNSEPANEVYPAGALYDVGVAIEFLRRRRGVRNVTLVGLCAGAYHSLRAAIAGLPVDTILLVNPLTFYWKPGATLSDLQISEVVVNPGVYVEHARSFRYWLRLLSGKVNLRRVAAVLVRRTTLAVDSLMRELCRNLGIRLADDLGWDLQAVVQKGIRIVFFFAPEDGGLALLRLQGGSAVERLGSHCRIFTIDGADHIFTQRAPRQELMRLLQKELPLQSACQDECSDASQQIAPGPGLARAS
jgi:hypothetical protein